MLSSCFETHGDSAALTSNQVRGETWTFCAADTDIATRLSRFSTESSASAKLTVVTFVDEDLEEEALRWLRRHDEREYSFVDATSFALMRSLKIKEALAFDGDFAAAGFVELRP